LWIANRTGKTLTDELWNGIWTGLEQGQFSNYDTFVGETSKWASTIITSASERESVVQTNYE